jgi:hypothetical protein
MASTDRTNHQIRQDRHVAELGKQRELLDSIPLLNRNDLVRVLMADLGNVLILTDFGNAALVIPAFQFHHKDGELMRDEATGLPLLNQGVVDVFHQQIPGMGAHNPIQGSSAWGAMYWWAKEMIFDASIPESQRPFRPMDVVHNPTMLRQLAKYLKDWREDDTSYG